ncbi:beta-2-glycoprotein 1 [Pelobates fuscus]|uniref:beta-2-glycoprotein 1 n=1 Tax=Pelobates fuscus TaxID=191477 RepID=UPI002FE4D4FD
MLWFLFCGLCLLNGAVGEKLCSRPREVPFATYKPLKILYEFRDALTYSCSPGYVKESGTVRAVCLMAGNWDHATIKCAPIRCPPPSFLKNGAVRYKDFTYGSQAQFSCNKGYDLQGAIESLCTETGVWSPKLPICQPITCPPPDIPKFGKLVLLTPRAGNESHYLDDITYGCLPKYALFGNESAFCTENRTWSHIPECRNVKCKRPSEIENGFMTYSPPRLYDYEEVVTYGCKPNYVLDGPKNSMCEKNGEWSLKPTCRAPCRVTTKKASVLLNGRKTHVENIANQLIQHGDVITYFCKDEKDKCSHAVDSRCQDGQFSVPSCYKDPGFFSIFSKSPSKLPLCTPQNSTQSTPLS